MKTMRKNKGLKKRGKGWHWESVQQFWVLLVWHGYRRQWHGRMQRVIWMQMERW